MKVAGFVSGVWLAVSVLAASASAAEMCDAADIEVLTTPAFPTSGERLRYFWSQRDAAVEGADVLFIGDSHVSNWPLDQLVAAFPARKVLKYGVGGDKIQNILYRVQELPEMSFQPTDIVMVVGANNYFSGDTLCSMKAGLDKLVDAVSKRFPLSHLYLIEVPPSGENFDLNEELRLEYVEELRRKADALGNATFVPLPDALFSCRESGAGLLRWLTSWISGGACPYFREDNTHLSENGYSILTEELLKRMSVSKENRK